MSKFINLTKTEIKNLELLDVYKEVEWFSVVANLKSGDSFGELALINNKTRKATIKCLTKSQFAFLEKEDYVRALKRIHIRT